MTRLFFLLHFLGTVGKFFVLIFVLLLFKERFDVVSVVLQKISFSSVISLLPLIVHLPLFWTGLITPIIVLGIFWNASDVLVVASKGDFNHPRLRVAMRRVAYLLILAVIAGTFIVPGLENAILGRPYRLSFQWSLNDVAMCAIGFGLIFFLYKKNLKQK